MFIKKWDAVRSTNTWQNIEEPHQQDKTQQDKTETQDKTLF